jgi:hypothetical protein
MEEILDDMARLLETTEEEIKETFKLITSRPITRHTLSVGKCIANIAQWHIIEVLKLGLMPVRAGNYYLIKAEVIEKMFEKLDKQGIEHFKIKDDNI